MSTILVITIVKVLFIERLITKIDCNFIKPLINSENCTENDFFDTNHMQCEPCLTSTNYDSNVWVNQTKVHIKSFDGFSCNCKSGFHRDFDQSINGRFHCSQCPNGSKPINGFECAICLAIETTVNGIDGCLCPKNHYMVEKPNDDTPDVIELKCEKCGNRLTSGIDGNACKPCHQSFLKASNECLCPNKSYIEEDGMCLPDKYLIKKDFLNSISSIEIQNTNYRFISEFFYRHSRAAVYNCKHESNRTACQLVANLCVLIHYSYSEDSKTDSNVCKILIKTLQSNPEIYYKGIYKSELNQNNVQNRFQVRQKLQLYASRFSIDGKLIGYSDLKDHELQLCYENNKSSERGFIFGTNFRQTCVRSAKDLWDSYKSENTFFELYLKHDNEKTLYGIPVLVKNLKKDKRYVNIDHLDSGEEHSIQLVRRFFLIDSISGFEKSSDDSKIDYLKSRANVLRYAKSINIEIRLRKQDGLGSIYPPLVTIEYSDLLSTDYDSNTEVEIAFSINYSMDDSKIKQDMSIALIVLCCAAVLCAIFRTWCWAKRSGKIAIDLFTIQVFLIKSCGMMANVFFFVHIFSAINLFIVFKNQSVIHTLLLTEQQETQLYIYIIISIFMKFFHLIYEILVIATIDIFFIDWERPKMRDSMSTITITRPKSVLTFNETNEKDGPEQQEKQISGKRLSISGSIPMTTKSGQEKPSIEFPNVTVWRSYFVSNEWMELCSRRRFSLTIHLLLVILMLEWFGLANLATYDSRNQLTLDESQRYVPESKACRTAIGALVYSILAVINIIFKRYVYERLISDKLHEFVDLCSVCNISVFCMIHKQYGYYIHGLAPNGKSDVNMLEMYAQLEREENDLCSKRGLLPNSDQQTFEMVVPVALYEHCQRLRSSLLGFNQTSDRMHAFGSHLSKADSEKLIPVYLMINKFLTGFIEHTFKDVDYIVRDKSSLESILDVEIKSEVRDKGYFYNDNGQSFEGVLFYSIELTLITFELMLFIVTDICFHSFSFSAFVTYITSKALQKLYVNISRKNLIRKSLMDERFLI